jgi:hypothetical protein
MLHVLQGEYPSLRNQTVFNLQHKLSENKTKNQLFI